MAGADNVRLEIKVCWVRSGVFTAVTMKVTKQYSLVGCDAVYFGENPTFRRNVQTQSSGSKSKSSKKPVEAGGKLSVTYFSTLKMEAVCSSETSGSLRSTRRCILHDATFHSNRRVNFKSNMKITVI
jgi:hypothetical protein